MADFLRTTGRFFSDDLHQEVQARVAIEDALLEQRRPALRAACRRLEQLPRTHVEAVEWLTRLTTANPALLKNDAALERAIAEAVRPLAEGH